MPKKEKKIAKIYSLKKDNKIIYIGKSLKLKTDLSNPSGLSYTYRNKFSDINRRDVEILEEVEVDNWYDPKLEHVVQKHKEGAKLRNAQWMLDGKRGYWEGTGGYWEGKKRDANTIKRMTESKYKPVCQYDLDGNLVNVWDSILDVARYLGIEVKKNKKGKSGGTVLNGKLRSKGLNTRLINGFYWIKREELNNYKVVPVKISINQIIEQQKRDRISRMLKTRKENGIDGSSRSKKVVRVFKNGKKGKVFSSIKIAAKHYKICPTVVGKLCRYEKKSAYDGQFMFEFLNEKDRNKYVNNKKRLYE